MLEDFFERLARAVQPVLAFALLFAILLNFINVLDRYLLGTSILWADEVQIYIVIWITFLGAIVASWRRQHLRMDVLLNAMPFVLQRVIRLFESVVLTLLCGYAAYHSFDYTLRMLEIGRASDTGGIPLWLIHIAVPVGFVGMSVIALYRFVLELPHSQSADEAEKT